MRIAGQIAAVVLLACAFGASAQPPAGVDPLLAEVGRGQVMSGATSQRIVLFTFDDGPDPVYTPRLLDLLDERNVKAVFFVVARRLAEGRAQWEERVRLARETVRRGHFVGLHGLDHASLGTLRPYELTRQLDESERIFTATYGARPWLFRAPGGFRTRSADDVLAARGYTQMMWNLHTGDSQVTRGRDVLATFQRSLRRNARRGGRGGGIIVLHDTHAHSLDGFVRIHDDLLARNCELVARGEELFDVVDHPRWWFAPRGSAGPSDSAPPGMMPATLHAERQARLRTETAARCAR